MSPRPDPTPVPSPYRPRRPARASHRPLRGLRQHVLTWGDEALVRDDRPLLVMLHGWMDVGASFQFVVDALAELEGATRMIVAPDWRGYGRTEGPTTDSYWFADYLGDLDAMLDQLSPDRPVDLLGHSMGGNVAMLYAGVRPRRLRRLVNLEGFGMPRTEPSQAARRYAQWLDALKQPAMLRPYADADEVAARLRQTNPRLPHDKAAWLARQWATPDAAGAWHLQADPAHKRPSPMLYRVDEVLEIWRRIEAPMLCVQAEINEMARWWGTQYDLTEFDRRVAVVPQVQRARLDGCGHMLHHDQPAALAVLLRDFLDGPEPRPTTTGDR